ncbi:DNA polymerase III subunit delta [Patescibacteria group bacterium]
MIIFLYGPDNYRSRQKLNHIVQHYEKTHKNGLNLKYYSDGQNLDFQDFQDEIQQTSMFKEKKLLVLINVFSNKDFKEKFLKNSKKFINLPEIILFYQGDKVSRPDSFFNFLKKNAKSQEFKLLEEQKLKSWIKKEFENCGSKIDPEVTEKLINFVGNDLWQLSNEIKKLASYKRKQKIEAKDVEVLVRPKIETDIFKTIDAIASKNKKRAFELLKEHLEKGESPLYLLSMISFQFRNLLIVKNFIENQKPYSAILRESGLHPFVVKKSYWQAQKFTGEELKKIYQKIFQVDLFIKTGKLKPEDALDSLLIEI